MSKHTAGIWHSTRMNPKNPRAHLTAVRVFFTTVSGVPPPRTEGLCYTLLSLIHPASLL